MVGLVLAVEMAYRPPLWLHAAIWLPLTVILALILLPPIKGALVGLQWALLMHGFDPDAKEERSRLRRDLGGETRQRHCPGLDFRCSPSRFPLNFQDC